MDLYQDKYLVRSQLSLLLLPPLADSGDQDLQTTDNRKYPSSLPDVKASLPSVQASLPRVQASLPRVNASLCIAHVFVSRLGPRRVIIRKGHKATHFYIIATGTGK